ncbi:MAG: hypothetical protein R2867_13795 [Caldilineaceae bacterium]
MLEVFGAKLQWPLPQFSPAVNGEERQPVSIWNARRLMRIRLYTAVSLVAFFFAINSV